MRSIEEVNRELEFKRQRMIDAGGRLQLTDPEVVRLSQEVDALHNEHMKITAAGRVKGAILHVC